MRLPIIVGMGGVNAAGRSSNFQNYRRMVIDTLPLKEQQKTLASLAVMMGLVTAQADGGYFIESSGSFIENSGSFIENSGSFNENSGSAADDASGTTLSLEQVATQFGPTVLDGTLVRRIEANHFDVDALHWQSNGQFMPPSENADDSMQFVLASNQVPLQMPDNWSVEALNDKQVRVTVKGELKVKLDNVRNFPFKAAGQLPSGFDISQLYNSRFQPRGLQMALFGATDALRSMGIEWSTVLDHIRPDQVGVYSSSGFGQMDYSGYGGMHQARLRGERVTTKALTMGINSMPTDFINAYVLANVGIASSSVAACATFLSNLRHALSDLQTGKVRVAMVGNSEAPIGPELMDGFGTMGALATDDNMIKLYGNEQVDHRRASRPFGENCGFTIGESSQYFILMDDELAMELGAPCLGAITDVFNDADGVKKSITAPGPGNHITMAKAAAACSAVAGEQTLRNNSFIMAHGSSTPQNRVTESQIFDQVAAAFGISNWPVVAVKAYLGHTIAPASGDQLAAALGAFQYGVLPGIHTIDAIADDVYQQRLRIGPAHHQCDPEELQVAILNSKGFGGNNSSAVVLSPSRTEAMLKQRYGEQAYTEYCKKREPNTERANSYFAGADVGQYAPIYRFGEGMIEEDDISISPTEVNIKGLSNAIELPKESPYADMC